MERWHLTAIRVLSPMAIFAKLVLYSIFKFFYSFVQLHYALLSFDEKLRLALIFERLINFTSFLISIYTTHLLNGITYFASVIELWNQSS